MWNAPHKPSSISHPRLLAAVAVGNAVIAGAITVLVPITGNYGHNLVYSELIGMTIVALMIAATRLLGPERQSVAADILIGLFATAGGFLIGGTLASWILGDPIPFLSNWFRQNMLVQIVAIGGAASLAYNVFFYFRRRVSELQIEAAGERTRAELALRQASEAQLGMIRAQIEPHMLFNTLANLRALIAIDPPAAQQMLDRLIAFMRATLSSSRRSRVSLKDEFAMLDDYLQLIAVRMADRMSFHLDLPADLERQSVLPLLLQPLVENAVRHGIETSVDGGQIHVSARQDGQHLTLRIVNSGSPYRPPPITQAGADVDSSGGFGLAQVRERLATAYGDKASLQIGALPTRLDKNSSATPASQAEPIPPQLAGREGTLVTLILPLSPATGTVPPVSSS